MSRRIFGLALILPLMLACQFSELPASPPQPGALTASPLPTDLPATYLPDTPTPTYVVSPSPTSLTSQSPIRPFPQHVTYAPGTIKPDYVSQDNLDQAVVDFYEAWKSLYLRQSCGEGRYYIFTTSATNGGEDSISVSEGHGYGMILTALMAGYDPQARNFFNGLYRFFKDHPSINSASLMAWNQVQGCDDVEPGNTGSATDGDMDIAYALLLADAQWSSAGEIDYRQEALRVIRAMLEHETNPETHTLLLGDWVDPSEPGYYYSTRSSDFMPGHLRAYQAASDNQAWQAILDATYHLFEGIQSTYSPQTGLLPDFIQELNGRPRPADPGFLEADHDGWYSYNACRVPWRIGVDYLLSGDARALGILRPLNTWMRLTTGGDPYAIKSGYRLDGHTTSEQDYLDLAFVAPLGVAAMVEAGHPEWLNAIWDLLVKRQLEDGGYYDHTLKLMALLAMSGNWWGP